MSILKASGITLVLGKVCGLIVFFAVIGFILWLKKFHPLLPIAVFSALTLMTFIYALYVIFTPKLTKEEKRYRLLGY